MTEKDLNRIDESIQEHGDSFWNDPNVDSIDYTDPDHPESNPNRGWIVVELLSILKQDGLDLELIECGIKSTEYFLDETDGNVYDQDHKLADPAEMLKTINRLKTALTKIVPPYSGPK